MGRWRLESDRLDCLVGEIFNIWIVCFSNYGGGGTNEFKILSKIRLEDASWDFCLNGNLSQILSKAHEVTHYFTLEEQKSVRFVQIRVQSVYQTKAGVSRGGLQYFSENTIGTTGARYQGKRLAFPLLHYISDLFSASVCPLDLNIFQNFDFSSLAKMLIIRGSESDSDSASMEIIDNFESLLVTIPHENDIVYFLCPSGIKQQDFLSAKC